MTGEDQETENVNIKTSDEGTSFCAQREAYAKEIERLKWAAKVNDDEHKQYVQSLKESFRKILLECVEWLDDGIERNFWTPAYTEFRDRLDKLSADMEAAQGKETP